MLSVISLNNYYKIPKQDYRSAVNYIEQVKTKGSKVVVIFTAEKGIAYYHLKKQNSANFDKYIYLRDVDKFNLELDHAAGKTIYIITTFHRALRIKLPKILDELEQHWTKVKVFPGTIGDGGITNWTRK